MSASQLKSDDEPRAARWMADAVRMGLGASEFYSRFLRELAVPSGTLASVAWSCSQDTFTKLAAVSHGQQESVELPVSASQHAAQLDEVRRTRSPRIFASPPGAELQGSVAPPPPQIVCFPVVVADAVPVIVEAYLSPGVASQDLQDFVGEACRLCQLAGEHYHLRVTPLTMTDRCALPVDIFRSLRVEPTCYALANECRRILGADRVTVLTRRRDRYRVMAVSGQSTLHRRANLIQALQHLVQRVLRVEEPFWYPEGAAQLAPEVAEVLESYLELSLTQRLGILPFCETPDTLRAEPETFPGGRPGASSRPAIMGALVVEQFTSSPQSTVDLQQQSGQLVSQGSIALQNALVCESIFGLPLWRHLGALRQTWGRQRLPQTIAVLAAATALLCCLLFVPAEHTVATSGRLMPVVTQNLFAPWDGTVEKLHSQHGASVRRGDLLAELRNNDLELSLEELRGQMRHTQIKLDSLRARQFPSGIAQPEALDLQALSAEAEDLKAQLDHLEQELRILLQRRDALTMTSPLDGQVVTWNLQQRLQDRPVQQGQLLLEVAQLDGPWCLELNVPDRRVGVVRRSAAASDTPLQVSFVLASDAGRRWTGEIVEMASNTHTDELEGPSVLVRVAIDPQALPVRQPGLRVQAKIHCGRRPLGQVWFGDVWHFIQSQLLFRLV